jgi:hypothetical protein
MYKNAGAKLVLVLEAAAVFPLTVPEQKRRRADMRKAEKEAIELEARFFGRTPHI